MLENVIHCQIAQNTIKRSYQNIFVLFFLLGLPKALNATFQEISDQFAKVKHTIQTLEECQTKANNIQEQIRIFQSMTKYLPMKEIEEIIKKAEMKLDDALILHKQIGELENQPGFMRDEDMKYLSEQINALKIDMSVEKTYILFFVLNLFYLF
jgi:hypothetical protein